MDIVGLENKTNSEIRDILNKGGKIVYFQYTISLLVMTQKNNSPFFYIPPTENTFSYSIKYFLLSLFFGWWGIPWGPIYTIETLFTTLFGGKNITNEVLNSIPEEFKTRAILEDKDINGLDIEFLTIGIQGTVNAPEDNYDVKYVLKLFDVTKEKLPILATTEDYQYTDSRVFYFESSSEKLPYAGTIFSEWSTIMGIPTLFLKFPRKGERKLEAEVYVIDLNNNILEKATERISFNSEESGYLDDLDNTEYFEEMAIKTAMLVSASDGTMDDNEANIVKDWIKRRLSFFNESRQAEEKSRLNGYIKDIFIDIESGDVEIDEVLEGIENIASEGEKFELFQLCLDVAEADGEADKAELKIIHDIADYIKLDRSQFRSMIEKTLPVTMHTGEASDESLLGIDSSMTSKEVRKHLREQYKKWNARVSSKDVKIREQAEKMIHLIAEARKKYVE